MAGLVASKACPQSTRPVALNGFDPVKLIKGEAVKGNGLWVSAYGLYSYQFVSKEDRDVFDQDPGAYAVRSGGAALDQPWLAGDPACYLAYKGRLYLASDNAALRKIGPSLGKFVNHLESRKRVAIMVFPGVQVIDYSGPYEVFSEQGYEVYTVAADVHPILTSGFVQIIPTYSFVHCPRPDIVVLPGGNVDVRIPPTDPRIGWIKGLSADTPHILSVCNGAFWLANAGLLNGKEATTFFGLITRLQKDFPDIQIASEKRFTDNGQIVCAAGLSSGIDGALHLVEKLEGVGEAKALALNMEYEWHPVNGFVRAALADKYLQFAVGHLSFPEDAGQKVIDVTDTVDFFDKRWELSGTGTSARALSESLATQFSSAWKRSDLRGPSAPKSEWTFSDDEGKQWVAQCAVKQAGAHKLIVSVRIERRAPRAVSKID